MTTVMLRRKFMVQHVQHLQQDASKHAKMANLDEFVAWEDEMIEAQLAVYAQRLWNKTDVEFQHVVQNEHQAYIYSTLAEQEEQQSVAQTKEAAEDDYQFHTYYQLAQEEAYEASHLREDYCDKYYIPAFWCRWVGQFAGWDSIQAQQSMQATNDMQLALLEQQAAHHAEVLARWYHTNATRHAQMANASTVQAQFWNASYQHDKDRAQHLDVITKELWKQSQSELGNATQYALDAQQEWQQAITLAHHVVRYQEEAVVYSIMAIVLASILFFLAFHHLVTKSCRNVNASSGSCQHDEANVLLKGAVYALGHVCIFILVLGGTMRDPNGHIFLLLLEQKDATLHESRGAIILVFAMQAALVQWMYLHAPSGFYHWMCRPKITDDDDSIRTTRTWQAYMIFVMAGFVKYWLIPCALFCMEMLILINIRFVSLFGVRDATWWFLFVFLLLVSAVHFLFQLPTTRDPFDGVNDEVSHNVSTLRPQASENTPLMRSCEESVSHSCKSDDVENSNETRSLVDVELASSASAAADTTTPPTCIPCLWCCHPDSNLALEAEIMSIREHASFLALPLTVLILVRAYNLIFYHCLPTLRRLHPGFPTGTVPIVMMIVATWLAVRGLTIRRHDGNAVEKLVKMKSIH